MTEPPQLPNCVPHEITQDNPLQGDENEALSHPPDEAFDDWSPADTERFVAMSGCDDAERCRGLHTTNDNNEQQRRRTTTTTNNNDDEQR